MQYKYISCVGGGAQRSCNTCKLRPSGHYSGSSLHRGDGLTLTAFGLLDCTISVKLILWLVMPEDSYYLLWLSCMPGHSTVSGKKQSGDKNLETSSVLVGWFVKQAQPGTKTVLLL